MNVLGYFDRTLRRHVLKHILRVVVEGSELGLDDSDLHMIEQW